MSGDVKITVPRVGAPTVLATLSLNLLALAMPLVILQLFDRVIPFQSNETLKLLFVGLIIVITFETILRAARIVLLSYKSEFYELDLAHKFMGSALRAEPVKFAETSSAEHLERYAAISHLRDFYCGQGRLASLELPFAVIFIAMIGLIGGWLIIVPIAGVAILMLFTNWLVKVQEPIFDERKNLDARRYSFLVEILSQISSIKLNTMERQMLRRFEMVQGKSVNTSHRMILFSGLSQSFGAVYSQTALIAMGLFGGYLVIIGNIGIAELAACMLLNGRTIQPFVKMLGVWAQSESVATSRRKLSAALSAPALALEGAVASPLMSSRVKLISATLDDPNTGQSIFRNVSAEAVSGDRLAIVSDNARAQSGLMRAIFGELSLSGGAVLIDGRPATGSWPPRGTGGIVYAGRKASAMHGTILQNIGGFGGGEQIEEALSLSRFLGLEKVVNKLPLGYNTMLGEGDAYALDTSSLKLVSLIRAMAIRPRILLLQDPTKGLDWAAQREFVRLLGEQDPHMTLVLATDDEDLIGLSDATLTLIDDDVEQTSGTMRRTRTSVGIVA